jgi:hypothetical protein
MTPPSPPGRPPIGTQPVAHRHVAVLKVADPKVLDEVRAIVALDQFVIGVVSETELVIDPSRVGQLASALAERGMAPLMKRARPQGKDSDQPRHSRRDQLEVDEDPTQAIRRRDLG